MEQPKNNLKIVTDKKTNARVILPNMLTLIGVCIGLSSIRFALDGKFEFAIIAIMFAALIDGLDGRIARLIKGTSKVGKELDSLTDMISFGVAPAFIMYFWKLNTLGRFGWLLCLTERVIEQRVGQGGCARGVVQARGGCARGWARFDPETLIRKIIQKS